MPTTPKAAESEARKARALANKLGCELAIDRRHRTITIHLPDGMQVEGDRGLNIRVNNCETMADAWLATLDDLRELADGGMEPFEEPAPRKSVLRSGADSKFTRARSPADRAREARMSAEEAR